MIDKVRNTVKNYSMLKDGDKVAVGVSGGADSMSLLSILCRIKEEIPIDITAVHINHGIRGDEAERDENFVKDYCRKHNIKLVVYKKNIPAIAKETGESEEECGRRIRYECFSRVCPDGLIATAHTLSDSIETMIFNMLRGCTVSGLCGIPEKRDNIIRPLIDCTRQEIELYCEENQISYVTDSTNLESDYSRNFIRNEIMPMFSRINPMYMTALARCQTSVKSDNSYIESNVKKLYEELVGDKCTIETKALRQLDKTVKSRLIYKFIKDNTGISSENKHISLVLSLLEKEGAVQLGSDCFVEVRKGILSLPKSIHQSETWEQKAEIGINITPKGVIEIREEKPDNINFNKNLVNSVLECYIDYDKIVGDIVIRSRQEGDKITLPTRNITKSLKKLFSEMKIPVEERNKLPVIADSEKVLWVWGIGYNKQCKADQSTKRVLKIIGGTKC